MEYRKPIRLKGYDYSSAGWYFITICVEHREHRFGGISNGEMVLNSAGIMIERWFYEIHHAFPHVLCDSVCIMPNHFHCILGIVANGEDANSEQQELRGIFEIMDWFKTMTTNEYILGVKQGVFPRFNKRIWQARYWDHIVRSDHELEQVRFYIRNNPSMWEADKLNDGDGNLIWVPRAVYGEEDWMV